MRLPPIGEWSRGDLGGGEYCRGVRVRGESGFDLINVARSGDRRRPLGFVVGGDLGLEGGL